jgi:hypothetical protein
MRNAFIVLVLFVGAALAQAVLNNDSVMKMAHAGLGDDVIAATIKSQEAARLIPTRSYG